MHKPAIAVVLAGLLVLLPPSLEAVYPELSLEIIRNALAEVRKGGTESLLEPYVLTYPHHPPASIRAIQLTTPYSRLVKRAWLNRHVSGYRETDADREYRQEGPAQLEVVVTISCGWPSTVSSPTQYSGSYWDGSDTPCSADFSLDAYRIAAIFKNSAEEEPLSRTLADNQPIQTQRWSTPDQGLSVSVIGGEVRMAIPLVAVAHAGDFEIAVTEPSGHVTLAKFDLPKLP